MRRRRSRPGEEMRKIQLRLGEGEDDCNKNNLRNTDEEKRQKEYNQKEETIRGEDDYNQEYKINCVEEKEKMTGTRRIFFDLIMMRRRMS